MIQRRQTIWLLLAAVAAFLSLKFGFFSGNVLAADQTKKFEELTATQHPILLVGSIGIGVASFIAVFLYGNRKLQLRISLISMLVSLVNLMVYYWQASKFIEGKYAFTALLSLAIPLFLVLAAVGINKDEKLVKSLDRLR